MAVAASVIRIELEADNQHMATKNIITMRSFLNF
jgi:hypothetical protein